MALFGGTRPRFPGQFDPYNTPPFYDPSHGQMTPPDLPPQEMPQQADAPEKFGWRQGLGLALGAIGDTLATRNGGQAVAVPAYFDAQRAKQAARQSEEVYQRRRADENTDWQTRQEWERNNPKPRTNDTIEDFKWFKGLTPEDRAIYSEMKPEYRLGPDGQYYRVSRAPTAPPAITAEQFQSGQPVGGGVGNGTGGFPR